MGEFPLYPSDGWQDGAPFSAVRLGRQSSSGGWGGAKERKQKKGNEKSVAQVFCVTKGGAGGARAQPRRCPLHLEELARGRLEFGRWLRFGGAGEGWQRGGRLEKLFDLLGPFHVICPRLLARQALDEVL